MNKTRPTRLIVIAAFPDVPLLEIAGPSDIFIQANRSAAQMGIDIIDYEVLLVAVDGSRELRTRAGIVVQCPVTMNEIDRPIDTLIVAGYRFDKTPADYPDFYQWLSGANQRAQRIGSFCTGAFALADAGLLKDKFATTHWSQGENLDKKFPEVKVDTSRFYTCDGNIYTSGGVSSGADLALVLVEEDLGRTIALAVARHLVLYLKRPGYQLQFGGLLVEPDFANEGFQKLYEWMKHHLDADLSVEQLAEHTNMSPRNFARVFHRETGTTPARFVEKLRVEQARSLLENTDLSLEQIATRCGLGGLVSMRRVFLRNLMVTPSDYRRSFKSARHAA